jgi:multidrug resistance efflux pump
MDILLILTYTAICYAIFKIFKIPVNKWTVPTAALGGVVIVAGLVLLMSYNHPFTNEGRIYFTSAPVIPAVQGPVVEVPVRPNVPLKKGDVLFRLDPRPYEYAVAGKRAALAEADQNVLQLKAALDAANSGVDEARASRDRGKQSFDRANDANEGARREGRALPITELEVENRRGIHLAAEAATATAQARADQARLAYESQLEGVNPTVARLRAELQTAEYELAETTVRAPTDGYVSQVFLRPGMMAVPFVARPAMVFIHGDRELAAAFVQNSLQRVRVGDEAEIAFAAVPGRIFKGKVKAILDAMAQGQVQPTGALIDPQAPERRMQGRALAIISVLDDLTPYNLPGGVTAEVALYTDHWHHVGIMRRILLRMSSWMNYVFLEH